MYYSTKARNIQLKDFVVIRHPQRPTGNVWMGGLKFCNGVAVVEKGSKIHRTIYKNPVFRHRKEFTLDWLPKFGFRTQDILTVFGKDVYYSYLKAVNLGPDLKPLPVEDTADEEMVAETPQKVEEESQEDDQESIVESSSTDEDVKVVGYKSEDIEEIKEELAEEINDPEFSEEGVSEELAELQLENVEKNAKEEEEVPELTTEEVVEAHKEMGLCVHIKDDGEVCKNKVSKGSPSGHYCFGHIKKDPEFIKKEEK